MGLAGNVRLERRDRLALAWVLLGFHYVRSLRAFLTLSDFELDLIAFLQTLVALRGDSAVVHKHIRPI